MRLVKYAPTALNGVRFVLPVPKLYVADGFVLGALRIPPSVIALSPANPDGSGATAKGATVLPNKSAYGSPAGRPSRTANASGLFFQKPGEHHAPWRGSFGRQPWLTTSCTLPLAVPEYRAYTPPS